MRAASGAAQGRRHELDLGALPDAHFATIEPALRDALTVDRPIAER